MPVGQWVGLGAWLLLAGLGAATTPGTLYQRTPHMSDSTFLARVEQTRQTQHSLACAHNCHRLKQDQNKAVPTTSCVFRNM